LHRLDRVTSLDALWVMVWIQTILAQDSPTAWFYWYKQYEALRDYVKGYTHMANASKATFVTTWLDK
jgi:hypothetical protein